jgi:hypothetical protein
MNQKKPAQSSSVNAALADFLDSRKEAIMADWHGLVLGDSTINAARSINTVALTNRLPFIFDDLNDTLRRYRANKFADESVHDAREHGATRWRQGYELSEVMRELKHFRSVLIYQLKQFEAAHPDHGMAALLFVATILHRFIDEMVIEVTEEFLTAQLEMKEEIFRRRLEKPPSH